MLRQRGPPPQSSCCHFSQCTTSSCWCAFSICHTFEHPSAHPSTKSTTADDTYVGFAYRQCSRRYPRRCLLWMSLLLPWVTRGCLLPIPGSLNGDHRRTPSSSRYHAMSYSPDLRLLSTWITFVSTTPIRGNFGGVVNGTVSFQSTRGAEKYVPGDFAVVSRPSSPAVWPLIKGSVDWHTTYLKLHLVPATSCGGVRAQTP